MTKIKNKTTGDWENVANLAQSDSVRNPDWSRAIQYTPTQLNAGIIAPEDGIMVGSVIASTSNTPTPIRVNNVTVALATWVSGNWRSDANFQVPVGAGDTIRAGNTLNNDGWIAFVPYRVQKSVEESHAVIPLQNLTTEGMTIAKWSDPPTSIGRFTFPKKGVYFCAVHYTVASTTNQGICMKSPFYSCGHANNQTIDGTFIVNATTDNYVLELKATSNTETPEVVNTFNISGQAIKLY